MGHGRSTARRAAAAGAAGLLVIALAGCGGQPTYGDRSVLTYNAARTRYLEGTCALREDGDFWRPVDARDGRTVAARVLPVADAALAALTGGGKPYPDLVRTPITRLEAVVRGNRAYFMREATATASAPSPPPGSPAPVPTATLQAIEAVLSVSSAPGSPNCIAHTPSPTPS